MTLHPYSILPSPLLSFPPLMASFSSSPSPSTSSSSPSSSSSSVHYVSSTSPVVLLDYNDVINAQSDLSSSISSAYGENGLGILVIKGIPNFIEFRKNLLPLAREFSKLNQKVKESYEHPSSHYSFGWSHGKETLVGGIPDYGKGSYYANPLYNDPFASSPEMIKDFPSFCSPNIWPKEIPMLEKSFMALGSLIVEVGKLLSVHVDKFILSRNSQYKSSLENVLITSKNPKARLLHYFPSDDTFVVDKLKEFEGKMSSDNDEFGSWCGWHNDHGSLTGLTSAMFFDSDGKEISPPTDSSGLYIKSRQGDIIKAVIPSDCLAFQIGETHTIHSGGVVQATPHAVKSSQQIGISRETFAVFMEPNINDPMNMPEGSTVESVISGSAIKYLPPGIVPLAIRWDNGMTFGEFTNRTLDAYHPDNEKAKLQKKQK